MRFQWLPVALVAAAACSDSTGVGVLDTPASLTSASLDGAVALTWSDNAYVSDPDFFENYRVYTTSYNIDTDRCGRDWTLEGTTVAPEFVVGALANGVPRCFTVTAVNRDGHESDRSPIRSDTPRPDAHNVALAVDQGFRFWDDLNGNHSVQEDELGLIRSGSSATTDFVVERDQGVIYLTPVRDGTGVELYSDGPIDDLTAIDFATQQDYRSTRIEAVPGYGYVFEMSGGDQFARYGAVRVTHVGTSIVIFDWAFQTDPGNPELKKGTSVAVVR